MKFDFHWPSGSEKTMFKYVDGTPFERPWLKGQRSTLTFETYL